MAIYQAAEPGNLVVECDDGSAFARLLPTSGAIRC